MSWLGGSASLSDSPFPGLVMGKLLSWFCITAVSVSAASSLTIPEIQGTRWLSPYNGQTIRNVTGVVSAKVCLIHNLLYASILISD